MNKYLSVNPEVSEALSAGKPVVALESTIISHGMPYPRNMETALNVERIIRENGAVPATICIIGGKLVAGATEEQIARLARGGSDIAKVSRRDLPILCARGLDGATTVATTMIIAAMAGIKVFATGGIGGVHRGAETTMDISADLEELAMTPVMVICAGAKSILDLGLTAPTSFPPSTLAAAASVWTAGSIRRRSLRPYSVPSSIWVCAAACLSATLSPKNIRWTKRL